MKMKKALCLAAALVLCLLTAAAGADGYGYYTPAVDISKSGVVPTSWEVEKRGTSAIGWHIGNLFDGRWDTTMGFVCWAKQATNDIPDISLFFNNATIKDIWVRNGFQSDDRLDYARIRQLDVTVWSGDTSYGVQKFRNMVDSIETEERSANMYDGYQRLSLKKQYKNVTRVDLVIHGWYEGPENKKETRYKMQIADMIFLPDALENIYGSGIFTNNYYYTPTAAPTAVPGPVVTPVPGQAFGGISVITNQRLATRSGPGTQYNGTGSYFQAKTWVKAISSAYDTTNRIWWIQVELNYAGKLRRVYTGVKRLEMDALQVPVEEASFGEVRVTTESYGYYGPGSGYDVTGYKVPAGTTATLWSIENDYAQIEYYDGAKKVWKRTWIPLNCTDFNDGDAVG